jgi:hypothetical protein
VAVVRERAVAQGNVLKHCGNIASGERQGLIPSRARS